MSQIRNLIVLYGALNSRERIFIAEEYSTFFPGFRVGLRSHNKANENQKGSSSADSAVLHDFLTCAHARIRTGRSGWPNCELLCPCARREFSLCVCGSCFACVLPSDARLATPTHIQQETRKSTSRRQGSVSKKKKNRA